jgi:hypothetical protein
MAVGVGEERCEPGIMDRLGHRLVSVETVQ